MASLNDRVNYCFEDLARTGDVVTFACRMANLGYESAAAAPLEQAGFRQAIAGRLPLKMIELPDKSPCCPYCGDHTAENVEAVELAEGDGAWADEITCGECGGVYRIVWRYVRVEGVQAPEKVSDR